MIPTAAEVDVPALSLNEVLALLGIASVMVGVVAGLWKLIALPQIAKQITDATRPIQSDTNGDSINARVNLIVDRQTEIVHDLRAVREDVQEVHGRVTSHMQWHMDHNQGNARTRSTD